MPLSASTPLGPRNCASTSGRYPPGISKSVPTRYIGGNTSAPLHLSLKGVPPPAQVVPGFCRRIGSPPEIIHPDDALPRVSAELGVDKSLLCQPDAGIVPGVLRFFQGSSPSDNPGPEWSPADSRLAAHVQLPGAHITPLVDFLEGEQSGVALVFSKRRVFVFGFRRMLQRLCWRMLGRVLYRRQWVGGCSESFP